MCTPSMRSHDSQIELFALTLARTHLLPHSFISIVVQCYYGKVLFTLNQLLHFRLNCNNFIAYDYVFSESISSECVANFLGSTNMKNIIEKSKTNEIKPNFMR